MNPRWNQYFPSSPQIIGSNQTLSYDKNVLILEVLFYKSLSVALSGSITALISHSRFVDCVTTELSPVSIKCDLCAVSCSSGRGCSRNGIGPLFFAELSDTQSVLFEETSSALCGDPINTKWAVISCSGGYCESVGNNASFCVSNNLPGFTIDKSQRTSHRLDCFVGNNATNGGIVSYEDGCSFSDRIAIMNCYIGYLTGDQYRGVLWLLRVSACVTNSILTGNSGSEQTSLITTENANYSFIGCYFQTHFNGKVVSVDNNINKLIEFNEISFSRQCYQHTICVDVKGSRIVMLCFINCLCFG